MTALKGDGTNPSAEYEMSTSGKYTLKECPIAETFRDGKNSTEIHQDKTQRVVPSDKSPPDKFNLVLISMYIFGIASLLPWNFFITANDYWMYQFRNLTAIGGDYKTSKTPLQTSFTSYLSISSTVPMVLAHAFNTYTSHRIQLKFRLGSALSVAFLMALLTAIFTRVDISGDQELFFIITMCTSVVINATGAIIQGSSTGLAGCLPEMYMKTTIYGMSTAGIFAAVAQIASLSDSHPTNSALAYFICATITLAVALFAFAGVNQTEFYQYHMSTQAVKSASKSETSTEVSMTDIFRQIWPYAIGLFLLFAFTLSVYPGVVVLTVSTPPSSSIWSNRLFLPVCCFFLFNVSDLSGRLVGGWLTLPHKKRFLIIPMLCVHIIHVPLLMLSNSHPRHHLPVIFDNDVFFVVFICTMGLLTGYMCNTFFIRGPKCVKKEYQQTAGTMVGAFQGVGLMAGSVASFGLIKAL